MEWDYKPELREFRVNGGIRGMAAFLEAYFLRTIAGKDFNWEIAFGRRPEDAPGVVQILLTVKGAVTATLSVDQTRWLAEQLCDPGFGHPLKDQMEQLGHKITEILDQTLATRH